MNTQNDCKHNSVPKWCFYCLQERVAALEEKEVKHQLHCHGYTLREMDYESKIAELTREVDILTKALQKVHLRMVNE